MFSNMTARTRRRDLRFRPVADALEARVALSGDVITVVPMPDLGPIVVPIFVGGDGPGCGVARLNPLMTTPTPV